MTDPSTTAGNALLGVAKMARKDEFYTQLTDVEKELRHYKAHFNGKVVYCNADDPRVSSFFRYFSLNFEVRGAWDQGIVPGASFDVEWEVRE